jgi:signal transduction histidine kinase
MDAAVLDDRGDAIEGLLRSVLALKSDVSLLAVTDRSGGVLSGSLRAGSRGSALRPGLQWREPFVERALTDRSGKRHSGLSRVDGSWTLAVAAPICSEVQTCHPVGVAIAGIELDGLLAEAAERMHATTDDLPTGLAIFDGKGRFIASSGSIPRDMPAEALTTGSVRSALRFGGEDIAVLYTPLEADALRIGTLAASVPTAQAFAAARAAGIRLASILLAVIACVMAIGALISRSILRQVRPLVETNRRLGSGDLTARAPVLSRDELGELAHGVNEMAQQLQADHDTLEMRVTERTEEVRRLLRERTELFAAISHEFRTPLAVIMGEVDMLLDPVYGRGARKAAESGPRIKESAAQLLGMVNDILSLAKAETGALDVDLRDVDLKESFDDVRGTIEGLAQASGLRVSVDVPDHLMVKADGMRLREIIFNLVDNAVKYTPSGGRVTVAATPRGRAVEVSVADTGVGIPREAHERIFEPFFRVKGSQPQRGQPSTGLGLALTKRLVEAHGGTIDFESIPGRGSTFRFTLKLSPRRRSGSAGDARLRTAPSRSPRSR